MIQKQIFKTFNMKDTTGRTLSIAELIGCQ